MFFVPSVPDHVGVMFVIKNRNISFLGHEQIAFQSRYQVIDWLTFFHDFCQFFYL